ncbi:MAG: nucleotidyl transferase AbiEii/AbiGii toxin family protein [Saprospiraceae bacterium]|jgi:predicted nucleotidyltransferase component of viral defense system|nr:nucleotidyl transferase AbiEii/AbiGii toxin family protein [Saprospiraceae bacterium]
MTDINRHKFLLLQILKDIYNNVAISSMLGFKGGTALMLFYDLPRFSVDLVFNLLEKEKEQLVFDEINKILRQYGIIADEAIKFYGSIVVLDYGKGERKLKVEVSNRQMDEKYEIKNYLGIQIKTMVAPDMFAHKLCALLDWSALTNRDIFDIWFFLQRHTPINNTIVENRMKMPLDTYLQKCIDTLVKKSDKGMLNGLGELLEQDMKNFVRTKLREETIQLLRFYKELDKS